MSPDNKPHNTMLGNRSLVQEYTLWILKSIYIRLTTGKAYQWSQVAPGDKDGREEYEDVADGPQFLPGAEHCQENLFNLQVG